MQSGVDGTAEQGRCTFFPFFFKNSHSRISLIDFRERGRERKREREGKRKGEKEGGRNIGWLPPIHTLTGDWRSNLHPRHVP